MPDGKHKFRFTFGSPPSWHSSFVYTSTNPKVWEKAVDIYTGPCRVELRQARSGWWFVANIEPVDEFPRRQ